ncbi:Peptidase C39 family protein [Polystyrenella longa]|uniref:Peptidase C39 family protein n=1 Tax=Polystyrenella longa TaxID=2528007 RepID=A0A518CNB1_9PLAN|nr:Peptidase C39 family protein [Polystyrenella longa]
MFRCSVFIVLSFITPCVMFASDNTDTLANKKVPCGVASTTLLLKLNGQDVTYSDVEKEFLRDHEATELMTLSFADLATVLRRFSVPTVSYRVESTIDARNLPTPSIIFIQDASGQTDAGHFVVLKHLDDDGRAVLADATKLKPNIVMPLSKLQRYWKGELLTTRPSFANVTGLYVLFGCCLVASLYFGFRSWRREKNKVYV